MMETQAVAANRSRLRRHPERGSHELALAHTILDAGQIAHVGFVVDGQPFVIPMLYARDGHSILLHGSVSSRLLRHLAGGHPCCLSVTHVDGWVLARSHFHHSVNFRSVVLFGTAKLVADPLRKAQCLAHLVEVLIPGRAADTRPADPEELAGTSLLELVVEDLSVKVREGGPKDHPDDLNSPAWAGVVPLALRPGTPEPAADLAPGIALPAYLGAR